MKRDLALPSCVLLETLEYVFPPGNTPGKAIISTYRNEKTGEQLIGIVTTNEEMGTIEDSLLFTEEEWDKITHMVDMSLRKDEKTA